MLKNLSKKAVLPLICLILLISAGFIFKNEIVFYFKTKQFAKAAAGLPWQFGGTITYYQPACASDPISGVCANCPMCTLPPAGNTGGVGNYTCNGYQEIQFKPAGGTPPLTPFVCVPKVFKYVGGGIMPRVGGFILGGGASNIMPIVIGISL